MPLWEADKYLRPANSSRVCWCMSSRPGWKAWPRDKCHVEGHMIMRGVILTINNHHRSQVRSVFLLPFPPHTATSLQGQLEVCISA